MKKGVLLLFTVLGLACKDNKTISEAPEQEMTLLDSIANAYGYENWKSVNRISFTFNVKRPDRQYGRSWIWDTRKNKVTSIIEGDTITYFRKEVDSTLAPVDARFINDKYWLLVPFNLVWDRHNFTYEITNSVAAPISGNQMRKLTIVYGDEGGYTPGDAYDFYLSNDLTIKEWAWRKGNDTIPRVQTVWNTPTLFDGLFLTTIFQDNKSELEIYFDDILIHTSHRQ